ncbi:MAG: sigma 54-interacting transcriptional regulator [Chitinivibrionales bacterium]|nr:sigma 54-interacting transcriptional regulator [Chitinivibrionales bacterium]
MFTLKNTHNGNLHPVALQGQDIFIGRDTENNIVIDSPECPTVAVRLFFKNGSYRARLLHPSKVVLLNGKKFKEIKMSEGDILTIAKEQLLFGKERTASFKKLYGETLLENVSLFAQEVCLERDLKKLLHRIIEILLKTIGGSEAFIFLLDADGKPEKFVSSRNEKAGNEFSDTIVQEALTGGKPVCIPNALTDPRYSNAGSISDLKLRSVICCPIIVARKKLGLIYLGSRDALTSFTGDDCNALHLFAIIAGMLINHVEYISQQESAIKRLTGIPSEEGIIAQSECMLRMLKNAAAVAGTDIHVLLEGETGTGKDLVAQFIHKKSGRSARPFVVVNCSTLKGELLESELFGHVKGAFTGATNSHDGLFCAADTGTLFLDEIGDMDIALQAKLLRTLETGNVRAVGASTERATNVRIICATNRTLKKLVSDGTFRQDLYYRLNQTTIHLPPLRERGHDKLLLAYFFLEKYKAAYSFKNILDFSPNSRQYIQSYAWPGNVRELANTILNAVVTAQNPLLEIAGESDAQNPIADFNFESATQAFQKQLIEKAVAESNGNKDKAAGLLGISRSTFYRMIS